MIDMTKSTGMLVKSDTTSREMSTKLLVRPTTIRFILPRSMSGRLDRPYNICQLPTNRRTGNLKRGLRMFQSPSSATVEASLYFSMPGGKNICRCLRSCLIEVNLKFQDCKFEDDFRQSDVNSSALMLKHKRKQLGTCMLQNTDKRFDWLKMILPWFLYT